MTYVRSLRNTNLFAIAMASRRCSGKEWHLNLATRQNPALNQLTTNVLQEFLQLRPWFRSLAGLEHHRMQIRPGSTSAGISTKHAAEQPMHLNRNKTPKIRCNALRNFSLHVLSKHSPLVQMQRERDASEPRIKTESGSQPTHSKRVASISATMPVVQILNGVGRQQIANVPQKHF